MLEQKNRDALVKARIEAVKWHNAQKEGRLREAKTQAEKILSKINFNDNNVLEVALALLYFGEFALLNFPIGMHDGK